MYFLCASFTMPFKSCCGGGVFYNTLWPRLCNGNGRVYGEWWIRRDLERSSYPLISVYCGIYPEGLPSYICPQSTGGLATVPTRPTEGRHIRQLSSGWQIYKTLVITVVKESRNWACCCWGPSKRWDLASCPTVNIDSCVIMNETW